LGAALGFGVVAKSKLGDSEVACDVEDELCLASRRTQRDRAGTYADVSTGLVITGGVLVGAGVVMFVLGGQTKSKIDARRAWVWPVVTGNFGGFSAGLRF